MKHEIAASLLLASVLTFGAAAPAQSQQNPLSFDVRGGYSYPLGDFGDNVKGDFGFGVGAVLNLTSSIGIYGGWGRDSFACDDARCNPDSQVHLSGFEAGAKLIVPSESTIVPWLKAGIIAHKAEFDGTILNFESDRRYGFQAVAGLDFPLGEILSVSPALRLNLLNVDDGDFFDDPKVRYLTLDIGAHIHIPRN